MPVDYTADWNHHYLFDLFPIYNYNNPTKPWLVNSRDQDGIRYCAWQMKAFHYWWIIEKCYKTGEIGLAINIDNLPFCLQVSTQAGSGHVFSDVDLDVFWKAYEHGGKKFPLLVASSLIPYYPCGKQSPKCDGSEMASVVNEMASYVEKGGVLIAAIMDETGPMHEGKSLRETVKYQHAWTVKNFEKNVLNGLDNAIWNVEEFDTFKSDMAYNVVLRRK